MAPGQITVRKIAEEQALDANNKSVTMIRVEFMVGDHGPFTERFTRAEFDGNVAKQKLQAFATQLGYVC